MNILRTPYYDEDRITIYHGDCREILPGINPSDVDLVLTDPPYGIALETDNTSRRGREFPRIAGDGLPHTNPVVEDVDTEAIVETVTRQKEALGLTWSDVAARSGLTSRSIGYLRQGRRRNFRSETLAALARALDLDPSDLVAGYEPADDDAGCEDTVTSLLRYGKCVLWGGNYLADVLPVSATWLVWDKRSGVLENTNADCELAWTNLGGPARVFRHLWAGALRDSEGGYHVHPTQKPVALMRWIVDRWTEPGDLVLDPYMGSGPVAQACRELGRRYIGVEIVEDYCRIAVDRLSQGVLALDA